MCLHVITQQNIKFQPKEKSMQGFSLQILKVFSHVIFFYFTKCILFVQFVIAQLLQEDVDEVGDLYLDVAEAYMEQKCFTEAKPILERLVCSQNYNLVRQINCFIL